MGRTLGTPFGANFREDYINRLTKLGLSEYHSFGSIVLV